MTKCFYTSLLFLIFIYNASAQRVNQDSLLMDLRNLSAEKMEGRGTGTPGGILARNYVEKRFSEIGLQPIGSSYLQGFEARGNLKAANVIARIPGESPEVIVLSAHYDHLGIRKDETYYGADDNAGGVAALIAIADYVNRTASQGKKPYYTLVIAAFDAEEMGLLGAKHFVKNPPVPLGNIALNINMDMITRNDQNELYVAGTAPNPTLKEFIQEKHGKLTLLRGHDTGVKQNWISQSDQEPFYRKGIPFLYFGVEDHADYHKPTDTFENIHPDFYKQAVEAILETLLEIDNGYRPDK